MADELPGAFSDPMDVGEMSVILRCCVHSSPSNGAQGLDDTNHPQHTSKMWWWATEEHHTLTFSDGHCASDFGFKVFNILENKENRFRVSYFSEFHKNLEVLKGTYFDCYE